MSGLQVEVQIKYVCSFWIPGNLHHPSHFPFQQRINQSRPPFPPVLQHSLTSFSRVASGFCAAFGWSCRSSECRKIAGSQRLFLCSALCRKLQKCVQQWLRWFTPVHLKSLFKGRRPPIFVQRTVSGTVLPASSQVVNLGNTPPEIGGS